MKTRKPQFNGSLRPAANNFNISLTFFCKPLTKPRAKTRRFAITALAVTSVVEILDNQKKYDEIRTPICIVGIGFRHLV